MGISLNPYFKYFIHFSTPDKVREGSSHMLLEPQQYLAPFLCRYTALSSSVRSQSSSSTSIRSTSDTDTSSSAVKHHTLEDQVGDVSQVVGITQSQSTTVLFRTLSHETTSHSICGMVIIILAIIPPATSFACLFLQHRLKRWLA
jgi:hypothetical protein